MTCSPDYRTATTVTRDKDNGVLVLASCTCGHPDHGFAATVHEDAFFNQDGDRPHLP